MITILKNNLNRVLAKPSLLITILILTAGAITAALFFSSKRESTANIAVVSEADIQLPEMETLKITQLEEAPPKSTLLAGLYDAVVTIQADGSYDIQTIKNEEVEEKIIHLLETGTIPASSAYSRGTGATIIGFLLMFLLMESSSLMCLFGEDKERKQIGRVLSAPVSIRKYLAGHSLFNFLYLFTATLGILYIIKWISHIDIGFSFLQYCLLIGIILALGTVFSLFLNAMASKSDNANMMGSSILVITTVLSGSFFSFERGNDLLGSVIRFLPQKVCLNIIENMEQGKAFTASVSYFLYLGAFILICAVITVVKTRRDYIQN